MDASTETPQPQADQSAAAQPWLKSYPEDVTWDYSPSDRTLPDMLTEVANRFPDKPAIDFLDKRTSYRELSRLVDQMTAGLQALGVKKGTHIGLLLPNCPYFVIAYYAALKAGATVVNFNPLYTPRELGHQVKDSEISLLVTLDLKALLEKATGLVGTGNLKQLVVCSMQASLPLAKGIAFRLLKGKEIGSMPPADIAVPFHRLIDNEGRPAPVAIDPLTDVAVIQYTGGTTGEPKGAMLTHSNLMANVEQALAWFRGAQPGEERMMAVIPFFHVFAMTGAMNLGLALGAEIIAVPRFEINDLMKTIAKKKPTIFPAVPTIYSAINHHHSASPETLSSIRICVSGGAPLPLDVHHKFAEMTGASLVEGYGLTETAPIACCGPIGLPPRIGSIGLPIPGTTIEIVSLEDEKTRMPIGEKGEIWIKGPQVMAGYWRRPDATARTLVDGFCRTGDVGIMGEDGYVTIVDRIKDLILAGGYNVYPRQVEEAIYLHPDVEECIVGGIPDAYRGETVKAWIKLKDGASLSKEALLTFLHDKLSPIERPRHIEFRDEPLPKTLIGKLSRKTVIEEEKAKTAPPGPAA